MKTKRVIVMLFVLCAVFAAFAQGAREVAGDKIVTQLTYACPGRSARYNFVDKDGVLQGYEIDIMREVDRRLPDVEIKLIYTGEFSALFPGLESGQFDIIGGGISWRQQRADNYLYSTVPYFHSPTVIGVRKDETGIAKIEDLSGRRVGHIPGTAQANWLEAYNQANPKATIKIDYVDASAIEIMGMVFTGRYDAAIHSRVDFAVAKAELGVDLKIIDIPNANQIQLPDSYYLYAKTNTALQEKIDAVLKTIRDDGTMSQLCIKWFGEDLVPKK
jgi:ABC-type amino acid transport substrate-binding protein